MIQLTPEIFQKYNVAGPRYTSYPTAPEWSESIRGDDYQVKLEACGANDEPLSLYLHIPFCESLCYYCGCNIAIRKRKPETADDYLDHLFAEMDQVTRHLGTRKRVQQFHIGGGTPTFLTTRQLERLFAKCLSHFDIELEHEIAIEIEPRRAAEDQLQALSKMGFNRVSMGIQDFDPRVQESVNRVHSFDHVAAVFDRLRKFQLESINIDLIYGLPHQSLKTFEDTIEKVIQLKPSRIALYSFAHIPWLQKQQKRLDVEALPSPEEKINIFILANRMLKAGGYIDIAMDHFALEEDEMAQAYLENRLNRNFMGYTVLPAEHFLGLGSSAIGCISGGYFQNTKSIPDYYKQIEERGFALEKGLILTPDDLIRKKLISNLMCRLSIKPAELEKEFGVTFDDYFTVEREHMQNCIEDGLLEKQNGEYLVTELGRLFVRNIAMGFDAYIRKKDGHRRFSRTI